MKIRDLDSASELTDRQAVEAKGGLSSRDASIFIVDPTRHDAFRSAKSAQSDDFGPYFGVEAFDIV